MDNLTQMVSSALAAARKGYGTLSTGEAIAAAMTVINIGDVWSEHNRTCRVFQLDREQNGHVKGGHSTPTEPPLL